MAYDINDHKHRFAAWAASRAASVNGCRFKVEQGKKIIERAGLCKLIATADNLPDTKDIDSTHRKWRKSVIQQAKKLDLKFTDGVAAKLINVYLKCVFVCGGFEHDKRVERLHPPIDRILLNSIYECQKKKGKESSFWREARNRGWSKCCSSEYEEVIQEIKNLMDGKALWKIEKCWPGHQ